MLNRGVSSCARVAIVSRVLTIGDWKIRVRVGWRVGRRVWPRP